MKEFLPKKEKRNYSVLNDTLKIRKLLEIYAN